MNVEINGNILILTKGRKLKQGMFEKFIPSRNKQNVTHSLKNMLKTCGTIFKGLTIISK